jgi:hypothetical protein
MRDTLRILRTLKGRINVTQLEIIHRIRDKSGIGFHTIAAVLRGLSEVMYESLSVGEPIKFTKVGTVKVVQRKRYLKIIFNATRELRAEVRKIFPAEGKDQL